MGQMMHRRTQRTCLGAEGISSAEDTSSAEEAEGQEETEEAEEPEEADEPEQAQNLKNRGLSPGSVSFSRS